MFLKRKVNNYLRNWKNTSERLPLIIKGARQIGKTESIRQFAKENYQNIIEINFALQPEYKDIFDQGFEVSKIIKNITYKNPSLNFETGNTLIFFDELQSCPNCATSLKAFKQDGRYDVICSGSLMGISYHEIESNSVGYKEDYEMHSMDFEEFLWAKGYREEQIEELYLHMRELTPLSKVEYDTFSEIFKEYLVLGGMPAVVSRFIENDNYSGTLKLQRQLLADYEEDIKKYAQGLDKGKILQIYRSIPVFLGKDNKKFQISKVAKGARNREYVGTVDWLSDAGIVNICYCMAEPFLPLRGNYDPANYRIYYHDNGLLMAALDDEVQEDIRKNKNFNAYKGAIFENVVASMLVAEGYQLYFYRNEKSTLELDFMVRDKNSLVPLEVKSTDGISKSVNHAIAKKEYSDIKYRIKLADKNIGYNGRIYTFPYFMTFMLKRWLKEKKDEME